MVIIAITWRWTGYNMIFYLAALQNIDKSIYEAARIDGVPAWARFIYITMPMLKPVILFTTIISTIGTIQLFDEVYNLTEGRGGPANSTLTLSLYIYNTHLPLHAELRLRGDHVLRHRPDGGAPVLPPVLRREGPVMNSSRTLSTALACNISFSASLPSCRSFPSSG